MIGMKPPPPAHDRAGRWRAFRWPAALLALAFAPKCVGCIWAYVVVTGMVGAEWCRPNAAWKSEAGVMLTAAGLALVVLAQRAHRGWARRSFGIRRPRRAEVGACCRVDGT